MKKSLKKTPTMNKARTTRDLVAAVTVLMTIALSLPVTDSARALNTQPCVANEGIKAMGSQPQSSIHVNHFIPSFERDCPAGVGKMAYDAVGDAAAVRAIIRHERGSSAEPYMMYTTDLPLTTVEKVSGEQDIYHPFRPALGSTINHFPAYVAGLAIGYKLPTSCSISVPLKLSSRSLSLIYSGAISRWNDPALVLGDALSFDDDNPGLSSCASGIRVAIREDEAAATIVLKDYLSQQNPIFNLYKTKELNKIWPPTLPLSGCRAEGDGGMTTCLSTPGTIGYVDYREAYQRTGYSMAQLQTIGGQFFTPASNISPTSSRTTWPDKCASAADSATVAGPNGDWSRVTLTNTTDGYPLCHFAYVLAFQRPSQAYLYTVSTQQLRTLVDYMTEVVDDPTQDGLKSYQVSPVPPKIRVMVRSALTLVN